MGRLAFLLDRFHRGEIELSFLPAMRLLIFCILIFVLQAYARYPTLHQLLSDAGLGDHAESMAQKAFTVETLSKAAKAMPDATLRLLQEAGLREGEALKVRSTKKL